MLQTALMKSHQGEILQENCILGKYLSSQARFKKESCKILLDSKYLQTTSQILQAGIDKANLCCS